MFGRRYKRIFTAQKPLHMGMNAKEKEKEKEQENTRPNRQMGVKENEKLNNQC